MCSRMSSIWWGPFLVGAPGHVPSLPCPKSGPGHNHNTSACRQATLPHSTIVLCRLLCLHSLSYSECCLRLFANLPFRGLNGMPSSNSSAQLRICPAQYHYKVTTATLAIQPQDPRASHRPQQTWSLCVAIAGTVYRGDCIGAHSTATVTHRVQDLFRHVSWQHNNTAGAFNRYRKAKQAIVPLVCECH